MTSNLEDGVNNTSPLLHTQILLFTFQYKLDFHNFVQTQ